MKKRILSIIAIVILIVVFYRSFIMLNGDRTNDYPQHFYDLTSIKHYHYDDIEFKKYQFSIGNIKEKDEKTLLLQLECDDRLYNDFKDGYSFYLGNQDELISDVGCNYEGDGVVELAMIMEDSLPEYNQIVIVENSEFKNEIVINCDDLIMTNEIVAF